MCTEWGALSGLFGLDLQLQEWLRDRASAASIPPKGLLSAINSRFTHGFIEQVFKNKLQPDKGAKYAKELYINLSTLSPYASGPNSVRVATPVTELAAQDIKIDKAYIVSCTNSRASDLAAAAKVFKDAAENYGGRIPKIA